MRARKRALRLDPVVTNNLANKVVQNKRAATIAFARATQIMPATTAAQQSHHAMADYLWTGCKLVDGELRLSLVLDMS